MSESSQEKQFKPSARRLQELRKQGQFLRSKDLGSGVILLIAIPLLILASGIYSDVIKKNFGLIFSIIDSAPVIFEAPSGLFRQLAIRNFLFVMPFCALIFLLSFLIPFLFGGFGFSMSLAKFKRDRIDPFKNLKKIFSMDNALEVLKAALKFGLLFSLLGFFIWNRSDDFFNLPDIHNQNSIVDGLGIIKNYLFFMMFGIIIIVMLDMLYSYFKHQKNVMMSLQEVKDEQKETDGNPEIKRKIRAAQMAASRQRIQLDVPSATVIITNPTHYAVALRYQESVDRAPKIVAMGKNNLATDIRMIAIKNAIPIYEAPELARAIYFTGKTGSFIVEDLYMAVAIVLAYIAQLKSYQTGHAAKPEYVRDLKIPGHLIFENKAG